MVEEADLNLCSRASRSNLGRDISYPDLRVFLIFLNPSKKLLGQSLDYATTVSFQALSNSSIILPSKRDKKNVKLSL
jgi:hypothetical protein